MNTSKVLIVSPTYNEIESIAHLISRIAHVRKELAHRRDSHSYEIDLLIVDDNNLNMKTFYIFLHKNIHKE